MEATFYGVRGAIPSPGPGTVRYGGNTACVAVRLEAGNLVILDCGTGARTLGLRLAGDAFGQGRGEGTLLLSHAHWDHIQGFPFFMPFYTAGNRFHIHGQAPTSALLEQTLEGQMSAQYFPAQSIRNMKAALELHAAVDGTSFQIGAATVRVLANAHGTSTALAFRIEDAGRTLVYASDADYGTEGPSDKALKFYAGADLLIHDCTFSPEDKPARAGRGLSSLDDAVAAARGARVARLALFHYDQDYSDDQIDRLVARGRQMVAGAQTNIELFGAAEGQTVTL